MKKIQRVTALTLLAMMATINAAASTPGSWELYPAQTTSYSVQPQQPINSDGSSNFKSNGKAVIPVKFDLLAGPGPVVFESILSDSAVENNYSFLSFTPAGPITFNDLMELKATYSFLQGNCGGGSLRWSVRVDVGNDGNTSNDKSVFIYYGELPNLNDCTTANQSGLNMIGQPDLRYDTTQVGGTFYDTYENAQLLVGGLTVIRASLVVDSGWVSDQRLTVSNVTVNGNTFVPLSGPAVPTCDLPSASIQINKLSGTGAGTVNEPLSIQPADNNGLFRQVDCKYMYNLATSSLSGPGRYEVKAVIGGNTAAGSALFDLR
jgi:hypothetical protein